MPSLRPTMGIFVGLPLALGAAAAPGCSSDSTLPLGGQCSLTSDCNSPLACIFEKCHQQCNTSQDCSMGARCVAGGGGEGGVAHVCQFSEEATCAKAGCPGNLVCGADQQCRAPCQVYDDCRPGQFCVSVNGTSACYQTNAAPDQATLMAAGIESADGSVIVAGSPNSVVSVAGDSGSDATATGGDGANAGDGGNDGTASGGNDGSVDSAALDGTSADATLDSTAASDALMEAFVPNPDAGCLGFTPTNFSPLLVDAGPCGGGPDVVVSRAGVVLTGPNDTDPGSAPRFPFAVTISMNDPDMTKADLYVLHSLTVDATASLEIDGPRPVILAVATTVDIQGPIYVWAGGFGTTANPGPGAGQGGNQQGSGGGGYCGAGGNGAAGYLGGRTYGENLLHPLIGGSAGSGGYNCGGAGAGAVQIVAGTSITVGSLGKIYAGGAGTGCDGSQGYGGGSGGAILLEAPTVTVRGNVAANGGGGQAGNGSGAMANGAPASTDDQLALGGKAWGIPSGGNGSAGATVRGGDGVYVTPDAGQGMAKGGGGGGAGRIRINTASGHANIMGIVSPYPSTGCATEGALAP